MKVYSKDSGNSAESRRQLLADMARYGRYGGATVKVAAQIHQHALLRRPIQVLYPLEVHSQERAPVATVTSLSQKLSKSVPTEPPQGPPKQEPRQRSQCSAAKQANDHRKPVGLCART